MNYLTNGGRRFASYKSQSKIQKYLCINIQCRRPDRFRFGVARTSGQFRGRIYSSSKEEHIRGQFARRGFAGGRGTTVWSAFR